MAIITVTRGSLGASTELCSRLSQRLGYKLVTREEVIKHGNVYGIGELKLADVTTLAELPPALWDRHSAQRTHYLAIFRAALMDFAVEGKIVYLGNLGQFLLADVPNLLRIRVDSDFEHRVKFLRQETGRTESEARAHIHDIDSRRRKWVKFLYGQDFEDLTNYDLVLNLAKLSADNMVDAVEALVRSAGFVNSESDNRRLRDAHLKAVIQAALVRSPRTRGMDLQVSADSVSGHVIVAGPWPVMGADVWQTDIKTVVGAVKGVTSVAVSSAD